MHSISEDLSITILIVVIVSLAGLLSLATMVWFHPPQEWSIFNSVVEILRTTLASALSAYFTAMHMNGKSNGPAN